MTLDELFDAYSEPLYKDYFMRCVTTRMQLMQIFVDELTGHIPDDDTGEALARETVSLNAKWNELAGMLEEKYRLHILPVDGFYNHIMKTVQRLKGENT